MTSHRQTLAVDEFMRARERGRFGDLDSPLPENGYLEEVQDFGVSNPPSHLEVFDIAGHRLKTEESTIQTEDAS